MKPHIKIERISLLLARIHRKMENYFCISADIWLLPDDLRHLSVNSPKSPYTSLTLEYLRVFNNLFRVDDKGFALLSNSIKRHSVSGRVSKYTWINKQK